MTGPFVEFDNVTPSGTTYREILNLAEVSHVGQAHGQQNGGPPQVIIGKSVIAMRSGQMFMTGESRESLLARFRVALDGVSDNLPDTLDKPRLIR